jgi:HEAT repeat protein
MRLKILFPCLLVLGISLALIFPHREMSPAAPLTGGEPQPQAARTATGVSPHTEIQPPAVLQTTAAEVETDPAARENGLAASGMSDDATAPPEIFSALSDPDPGVRCAAREAAVQLGSRDAIPWLQAAIAQVSDIHEKAAMQSAIEYLELPTLAEVTERQ